MSKWHDHLAGFTCRQCVNYHKSGHPGVADGSLAGKYKTERNNIRRELQQLQGKFYRLSREQIVPPFYQNGSIRLNYYEESKTYDKGVLDGKKLQIAEFAQHPPPIIKELTVGYRVWLYDDGYLRSAYKTEVKWPHRKMLTRDVYDNAGIHACKEYKRVIPLLQEYCQIFAGELKSTIRIGVAGAVHMWGEVKEHETGYLSEFAYPKEFYVGDDFDPLMAMQLEENYGVPVNLRAELTKEKIRAIETLENSFSMKPIFLYPPGIA